MRTCTVFFNTDIGLSCIMEIRKWMSDMSKIRTPEQKSKKMLKEEMIILDLEMAIKKEQFRNTRKAKSGFHEVSRENKDRQMVSMSVHETDVKSSNILNSLLNKIGF